jgi:hypothetical protein
VQRSCYERTRRTNAGGIGPVQRFAHRRRAPPGGFVGQLIFNVTNRATGERSMIRHTTMATTTDTEVDDRSMRVVEWAMALIAAVVAGILAFIR